MSRVFYTLLEEEHFTLKGHVMSKKSPAKLVLNLFLSVKYFLCLVILHSGMRNQLYCEHKLIKRNNYIRLTLNVKSVVSTDAEKSIIIIIFRGVVGCFTCGGMHHYVQVRIRIHINV
jgi:hypothetical protein